MTAPSSSRAFVAAIVARAAFGLTLLAVASGRVAAPAYYPIERRWALVASGPGLAMGWYGQVLVSLAVAGLAALLAWFALSGRRALSARTVTAIARAGALVVAIDFIYFGWILS